ncbi:hypothetical protein CVT25_015003 [Psilocybe cyanescens]|uniref:Zn(2)-C6 fungal-type domain-containing protein n=1 Tax=Psilocybe cyanescens TaxID=93625 RepID=A0A409XAD4_PSICY|nr:hypothetical protein CVT25_015003 [Psilocybe cyanescens]
MSNNTIFANSDALVGCMLHLENLIQKGAKNGNILEVFKAQKASLRNVLIVKEDGLFKETIEAHHHLFFWTPVYEYYSIHANPDFNPAQFEAKYKNRAEPKEQQHAETGYAAESAGGGMEGEKQKEGASQSREVVQGGTRVEKNRSAARAGVGHGTGTERRSGGEVAGASAVPIPVPVRPRVAQVMQPNTNPIKSKATRPGPQEASGSKGPQKASGSKPRPKSKTTQVRGNIPALSTGMRHHLLALQMFDMPEPASSHTFRHIASPPRPTAPQRIRPPSIELSRMTITPNVKRASQVLHSVGEDKEMHDGADSGRDILSGNTKPASDAALGKKRKRSIEPMEEEDEDDNAEGEDDKGDDPSENDEDEDDEDDDDEDDDDPHVTKALPGSRRLRGTAADQPTRPPPKRSNRAYAVTCLRCKRRKLDCMQVEGRKSGGSCFYCTLTHTACRTGLENDGKKDKGKGKGKGKGNATQAEGKGAAEMLAAKRARMDGVSGIAFNTALADITAEDIERWRALDNTVPRLEDRIEKLEEEVARHKKATDKAREQVHKNADVIQKFDDKIGDLCNAVAELEGRVARLQRQVPSARTATTLSAANSGSGVNSSSAATTVIDPRPHSPLITTLPLETVAETVKPQSLPPSMQIMPDTMTHPTALELRVGPTAHTAITAPESVPVVPLPPITFATDIPSSVPQESVRPALIPDTYLHRKFDPNRPSHGCIYHNVTGAVIWRYNPGPATVPASAIEDVDMGQREGPPPETTFAGDEMQTDDDQQPKSPPRREHSTPAQSSVGSQPSLPIATSSSEGYCSWPPLASRSGADSAPSTSTGDSQTVVVITRRPTPVSPLSHRSALVDHDSGDDMDAE